MTKDTITVLGEKADGSREVIGAIPTPPEMKRKEIVANYFSWPSGDEDDYDEANACLWALEDYHEWLLEQGWVAPKIEVTKSGD